MKAMEIVEQELKVSAEYLEMLERRRYSDNYDPQFHEIEIICMKVKDSAWQALKAVLEMHRKGEQFIIDGIGTGDYFCAGCSQVAGTKDFFPCPTVQAIETALGVGE